MSDLLSSLRDEFRRQKSTAERAMEQMTDEQFFIRPGELVNPVALIVKHLAGNFVSRWTDFLTTDGEKPNRDRDGEFIVRDGDTRVKLMADWEHGWAVLLGAVNALSDEDIDTTIHIRGEPMTARVAVLRALTHLAYHVGQITYLMRLLRPDSSWLSIAPGQSKQHAPSYTRPAK